MIKHKILLPDGTVLTSGKAGTDAIRSVTLTEQVNDETDLCPGAACAACVEIELWAPQNGLTIQQGTEIRLYRMDSESGAEEAVGIFVAEQPQKKSANVIQVTAYDRMTLLDKNLSPWLRDHQGDFPVSLAAFIRAVCGQCGVSLADGTLDRLPNATYQVRAFYADDLTGRQLIQWAAQAVCCLARMTPDGSLEFAWYAENAATGIFPDAAEHWVVLDLSGQILTCSDGSIWTYGQDTATYYSGGLTYEDYKTAPLDKVQIRQSDDDVGVIWPPDAAGTNAWVIQGNLLLTTDSTAALQPVAQALYERLQRINYTPLEVSLLCTMDMPAPGQIITVTDAYGRPLQMYVMQRTITGQKATLKATGNPRRDSTAAVNSQTLRNLQGKMLEIKTSVDGLNVTASNLQNDYTKLTQTVDGLELTVVKDGEVRTKFAADSTSVTISSGVIGFTSNSITIDSNNFKLQADGTVTATGSFSSNNGIVGNGRNVSTLSSGGLTLNRTTSDGQSRQAVTLYGIGSNASFGYLEIDGTRSGSVQGVMFTAFADWDGSHISMRDGSGGATVSINGGSGSAEFTGDMKIQGPVGLEVSKLVRCQTLDAWGGKSRVVPTCVGNVRIAAFETPEPCFADSGSGELDDNGKCLIVLDPIYADTIDAIKTLRWLITPSAEGEVWVEKRNGCAMIHGTPGLPFDWLCIGAQRGYADVYAERCYDAPPTDRPAAEELLDWAQLTDTAERQDTDALLDAWEPFFDFDKGDNAV